MQLDDHLSRVSGQLRAAAALGDDRTREIADSLAAALGPAVRLAVLGALSSAADEITAALLDYPGAPAVAFRLDGDEVAVDVHTTTTAVADDAPRGEDGDANARISLRLSESLKEQIDAAADRDGVSVNTWLVRAASLALRGQPGPFGPFGPTGPGGRWSGRGGGGGGAHHITGWVTG
jgi:hypothetical protein